MAEFVSDDTWEALLRDGEWVFDDPDQNHVAQNFVPPVIDEPQTGGNARRIQDHIHIEFQSHRTSSKYRLHFKTFRIKVNDMEAVPFSEIPLAVVQILENVLETVLANVAEHEKVRIRVDSRSLDRPIWTPPTNRSELSVERWMAEIERVLNSYEAFVLDDSFEIVVQHTEIPLGRCLKDVPALLRRRLENMRSVVVVKGIDNICMAKALVLGKAIADEDTSLFRRLKRGKRAVLAEAKKLIRKTGFVERPYTLTDLIKFEEVLEEYRIIVVSVDHANAVVHSGKPHKKKIILLHHNGHYDVLKSLPAFFKRSYWCFECMKGYDSRLKHRCSVKCSLCLRDDCPRDEYNKIGCKACGRMFLGQNCFDYHKLAGGAKQMKAICTMVSVCKDCRCIYSNVNRKPDNPHRCGEILCKVCSEFDLPDAHKCWMKPKPLLPRDREKSASAKFLYFDFETYVSESGQLVPNLAVVQNDDGEEWIFPDEETRLGKDVTDAICEFLFKDEHKGFYIIAHNFKAFDGYFILNWLLRNGIVPKIIMNGGKIMQMDVVELGIHFRDSINYNPQSLSKWPATFGLEDTCKGTFPHHFNRSENWDKILDFPSKNEYGYASMNAKEKSTFDTWYGGEWSKKKGRFDFRKEFEWYCRNDVTVLRKCCQQFRQLFMGISDGLCPFVSAITIAGVCNMYWRTFLLQPNQIAIVPEQGYARNRFQSAKALRWLQYKEVEDNCVIQTKLAGSEFKIGSYFVDGYCQRSGTVYEFHGCWYHGCPKCTNKDTTHPYRSLSMGEIYAETMNRDSYIRDMGYQLTVCWEHEYDSLIKEDIEFREFVREAKISKQLNPRDAFYGGRTNALKLHHKISADEKICYYDVCSEYPYINKNKRYPTGHPKIITRNFVDVHQYFGMIYCKVLPPGDLLLPVLPYRSGGKLLFPLCRTCADQQLNEKCRHGKDERCLEGTWCTPEIVVALAKGYSVLEVFEVWQFDQYEDRLFQPYIDKFLKIKVEASGWPNDVCTSDEKDAYIQEYDKNEGIKLDAEKIQENPGMRALAKLCLNSFWGRLGMKSDKARTEYVSTPARFYELLMSGQFHVHSWDMFGEETVQVMYTMEEGFGEEGATTNVVLAAFTTCWARLHLLQFMELVQDRLLYFDTDSIVFVDRPGMSKPSTGRFLGDLTSELKPDQHIVEFVSLGAKTYAYVTNDGQAVVKVKGFTLNGRTSEVINFNSMLSMLSERNSVTAEYPAILKRHKASLTLKQTDMLKKFRMTYDKRRIVDESWNTLPYGYTLM